MLLGAAGFALSTFPAPDGLSQAGWIAVSCALGMAIWWMTEAIPLPATALVPLAMLPLAGVQSMSDVAAAYAHPLIFLFLGGFLIGRCLEQHDAPQKIGSAVISIAHGRPRVAIGGLMAVTAFCSLWISNTATAMIMAPVGAAVVSADSRNQQIGCAALCGVAFAATIGGMGSLIGTPPNAIFAAWAETAHGLRIGFAEWALLGIPVVVVFLPIALLVLTRIVFDTSGKIAAPPVAGPLSKGAKRALGVAAMAAAGWAFRPIVAGWPPLAQVTDAGVAVSAALCLFLLPDGRGSKLLTWDAAKTIRWDVLILFGGGLALAGALDGTGAASWLATLAMSADLDAVFLMVIAFATLIVITGELASNTAMAAIFLPVAGATAVGLETNPIAFVAPIALAASIGFALPVATPPNAIVFAYPAVTRTRMMIAGAPLDIIGVLLASAMGFVLAPLAFGG